MNPSTHKSSLINKGQVHRNTPIVRSKRNQSHQNGKGTTFQMHDFTKTHNHKSNTRMMSEKTKYHKICLLQPVYKIHHFSRNQRRLTDVKASPDISHNFFASLRQCMATYCGVTSPMCIINISWQCGSPSVLRGKHCLTKRLETQ